MNSKQILLQKLKKQFDLEKGASEAYSSVSKKFTDKKLKVDFDFIAKQEIEHMNDVQEIIDLISGYKKGVNVDKIEISETSSVKAIESSQALILIGDLGSYLNKLMVFVKQISGANNILYVSFNKMPSFIKSAFNEHKISISKIKFISCATVESKGDITIRPEDLTQLSISLTEETQKKKDSIVLIDSITSFSTFHTPEKITKFVSVINDKARSGQFKVVWVALSDADTKGVIEKITPVCDKSAKL
jgi:hypothetical protein